VNQKIKHYYKQYYSYLEGHYNSYWLGKLVLGFMSKGSYKLVEKEFKQTYIVLKLKYNVLALNVILETIEKIKPFFMLKFRMVAGKKKEFPVLLTEQKQRGKAVRNLKFLIKEKRERFLNQKLLNELLILQNTPKTHNLIKQRDEDLFLAADNRFNIRFSYKR
jgi:ribosomal protein S7